VAPAETAVSIILPTSELISKVTVLLFDAERPVI